MRANASVCVEVDDVVSYDQWVSVIATGRYEELPDIPGSDSEVGRAPERSERQVDDVVPAGSVDSHLRDVERERAHQVLETTPMWQEPGSAAWVARAHRNLSEPLVLIFYRILVDQVTGHEASRGS
jgi:nitroimidazol reductase NimA-like FMN-containing flavoprotein (pyridoxamine 5'-phosphate oxidase superfamily)